MSVWRWFFFFSQSIGTLTPGRPHVAAVADYTADTLANASDGKCNADGAASSCYGGCNLFMGGEACEEAENRRIFFDFDGTLEQKDALAHDVFAIIEENTEACHKLKKSGKVCATEYGGFSVTRSICTPGNGCNAFTKECDKKTKKAKKPCYPPVDPVWMEKDSSKYKIEVTTQEDIDFLNDKSKTVTEDAYVGSVIMIRILDTLRTKDSFNSDYFESHSPKRLERIQNAIHSLKAHGNEVNVLSASWAPIPGQVWRQYLAHLTKKVLKVHFHWIYGIDDPGGDAASDKGNIVATGSKPVNCAVHIDNSFKYAVQALNRGAGGVSVHGPDDANKIGGGVDEDTWTIFQDLDSKFKDGKFTGGNQCEKGTNTAAKELKAITCTNEKPFDKCEK